MDIKKFDEVTSMLSSEKVSKQYLLRLFDEDDPGIIGYAFEFLADHGYVARIDGKFSWEEAGAAVRKYYYK